LTNTDSSPPGKPLSPRSMNPADGTQHASSASYAADPTDLPQNVDDTMTPVHTPPDERIQARPGPGEEKGEKIAYDPLLDYKLQSLPRHERKLRGDVQPRYRKFGVSQVCRWVFYNQILFPKHWSSCDANSTCAAGRPVTAPRPPFGNTRLQLWQI
jgi:hypothetical protein